MTRWRPTLLAAVIAAAASMLAMRAVGLHAAAPPALIYLSVIVVPFGYSASRLMTLLDRSAISAPLLGVAAGVALVVLYAPEQPLFVIASFLLTGWLIIRSVETPRTTPSLRY